ncbi:GH15854 [Drosophila grimshawi]|uniref:GH15854 n=1 Tax=Drosophila grimshawi TaxID=7222 RepID=B4J0A4_DROGR|nr:GH15854 [Drosophila grimshawi]
MWKKLIFCCCVGVLTVRLAKVLKCIHVKSRVLFDFQCVAHVTFTNLKCTEKNRKIGEFDYCYIKAVNRTHKYISLYYKLYERPLSNITLNIKLFRNSNGYKPFFIDFVVDACQFLKRQDNPIIQIFYEILLEYSNMNHTCPYSEDIFVDKFYTGNIESQFIRYIPVPDGEYIICYNFLVKKLEASNVCIYLKVLK